MNNLDISIRDQDIAIVQKTQAFNQSRTTSLEVSKQKSQIPVLDGLRAVACLAVLSYHVNFLARVYGIWRPLHGINTLLATLIYFGESGVILFFLLSGFLLFLPYAKALLFDSPWPGLRRFYLRRIFRIVPGYFVAIFLIALFFHPEFLHHSHWHDLWLFLTFRMDNTLSQQFNGPFWTLAVEFQFYLLLPIISWLFSLIVRRGTVHWRIFKLTLCLFVMTAWGLLTRYWGLFIADTPKLDFLIPHSVSTALKPYIYGDTSKFFEVFAVGMLICMAYIYIQNAPSGENWKTRICRLSPLILTVGLAILFFLSLWHFYYIAINPSNYTKYIPVFTFLDPYIPTIVPSWLQWQAMGYAISYGLCLWALLYATPWLKRVFEWPILRGVGLISFSLYMWHLPFIFLFLKDILNNILQQNWNHSIAFSAIWCWTLFVIIPISAVLYRWIEQPGMRLGERLIRKLER
jgi:peptidoglycan/LPS O-acetylase OafA/YrhL